MPVFEDNVCAGEYITEMVNLQLVDLLYCVWLLQDDMRSSHDAISSNDM